MGASSAGSEQMLSKESPPTQVSPSLQPCPSGVLFTGAGVEGSKSTHHCCYSLLLVVSVPPPPLAAAASLSASTLPSLAAAFPLSTGAPAAAFPLMRAAPFFPDKQSSQWESTTSPDLINPWTTKASKHQQPFLDCLLASCSNSCSVVYCGLVL